MRPEKTKSLVWFLVIVWVSFFLTNSAVARTEDRSAADIKKQADAPAGSGAAEKSPFHGASPEEQRYLQLTLDNMDIYPVLEQVLGNILELNYVVEPTIKGTISLNIKGHYTRDGFLNLFNSILQTHGLAITWGSDGVYKVVRKAGSAKAGTDVVVFNEKVSHAGDVIRVFQLKYLSAAHVIGSIRNFVSQGALVVAEPATNSVILVDTRANGEKVAKLLSLIDTDFIKNVHWRMYTLDYTEVEDVSRDLDKIFKTKGLYSRPGIDTGGFKIMPLKSINALLVVTKWKEFLELVGNWVKELDQGQSAKGTKVFVYFVQHAVAEDLADILRQVYGAKSKSSKKKKVLVKRTKKEDKAEKRIFSGELSDEVQILPDKINNALVIKARQKDYDIIMNVLEKLDVVPRQVLIDVLIMEVSLDDGFQFGVEWFIQSGGSKESQFRLNDSDMGGMSPDLPLGSSKVLNGFTYSLFGTSGDLKALVHALQTETDINILSAPNILAVDNKESNIEIVRDVPTVTSASTSGEGVRNTTNIQYQKAGIILKVTPSINEGGLVRMELTQEVSNVLDKLVTVGGVDTPVFQTRKATTNLVVQDSHTIMIGGLMDTQKERRNKGIPLLKDIPVLGYLFGTKGWKTKKTELLFFITPHVIHSQEQADRLTQEFSARVHSLKKMIEEKGLGGKDNKERTYKDLDNFLPKDSDSYETDWF
ncbi:MAG TPA: type II secretion system protein GspD [Thermodesulfobacteriaceae bacterium]|nr:type II secretion system protein GspD [Thermodesulfobacteriaceae bacterium]